MRQGNHSNAKWALAVAALVVLVSGSMVLGSNMGFKLNMPIAPQTGALPQGFNIMSIPYLTPYTDRQCLCEQLGLTPLVAKVQEFEAATGVLDSYTCDTLTCGSAPSLTSGTATFITDALNFGSAIVVGAHDPSKNNQLACNTGALPQGDNWVSLPYHSTSATFQAVCDEVGPVDKVAEFDASIGVLTTYTCDVNLANDGPLTKGRAVKIVLDTSSAECTGVGFANWVPNHF